MDDLVVLGSNGSHQPAGVLVAVLIVVVRLCWMLREDRSRWLVQVIHAWRVGRARAARAAAKTLGSGADRQGPRDRGISNSRRVPECACGRLPGGSGLDQGLRSWAAPGVSF